MPAQQQTAAPGASASSKSPSGLKTSSIRRLARAHRDEVSYRDYRDRYRAIATSLGFEGHMAWAETMP